MLAQEGAPHSVIRARTPPAPIALQTLWPLLLGALIFLTPTLLSLARESWTTEQGAHGPIILAIGIWLAMRRWPEARASSEPGSTRTALLILVPILLVHALGRMMHWVVVDALTAWAALMTTAYAFIGLAALRRLLFPLAFLLFAFPPPDAVTNLLTQPVRLMLADAAVSFLWEMGYPIAQEGLSIFIGQYELLVEDACSGLNSLISLTAIGLFYSHVRHDEGWRYHLLFTLVMVVVAIGANFVRVLLLILITYHLGESASQGFLHDLAGFTLFGTAIAGMLLVDSLAAPFRSAKRAR